MDVPLDAGQQAVVSHDGGPLRVVGSFGSGITTALRARADHLAADGSRPLLLHHRDLVPFAVDLLGRHGEKVALATAEQRRAAIVEVLDGDDPAADEAARAVLGFQASWLGDEELRVHADAAGQLAPAERLIAVTRRYLAILRERGLVDAAGAVVRAGLSLRDDDVLDQERRRFDELLVDDFQLATFAEARLLTQLVGRGGPLVVGGNPDAAVSRAPLASGGHLERFARRFACRTVALEASHRVPGIPNLHLAAGPADAAEVVGRIVAAGGHHVTPDTVEDAVGREWPVVVVDDATAGAWPRPRPRATWFDEELFHGPDIPTADERDRRWLGRERARFRVAVTRATEHTVVVAPPPATPFLDDLLR